MHIQKQIATLLKEDIDPRVHPDDVRPVKMMIIQTLKTRDEQDALVALVRGCFLEDNELTNCCKAAIKTLRLNKTISIFDFIFAQESTIALQKKMFELMDELQGAQMLQYVLRTLNTAPERASEYQEFASWLRASRTREKYVRMAINLRQEVAKRAITILTSLDSSIPICLAQITEDLNPEKTIKALQILVELNLQSAVASMIPIRKLMRHPESQVRALIARLVGATLQNLFYIRFALSDPAITVRLSILESIELGEERISDKLVDLLYTTLTDFDPHVRAKTAQIFHFYKDVIGLKTLVSMLEGDDAHGRAYAAHFLGELKELSVRDTLQHLSQNDPNLPVRREATKALQTLEGEVEEMHEGFEALIGILTQRRFSGDDDLRIWDYLEGLDAIPFK